MRQAIKTKYLGPSNVRGARVKASSDAGSVTLPWNHALGIEDNHAAAAKVLAEKWGWGGRWFGGGLPGSGYAFVDSDDGEPDFVTSRR
jgi:hypothetical protein